MVIQFLQHLDLFSEDVLRQMECFRMLEFDRGEVVYECGDKIGYLYWIFKGSFETLSEDKKHVSFMNSPEMFSEQALLNIYPVKNQVYVKKYTHQQETVKCNSHCSQVIQVSIGRLKLNQQIVDKLVQIAMNKYPSLTAIPGTNSKAGSSRTAARCSTNSTSRGSRTAPPSHPATPRSTTTSCSPPSASTRTASRTRSCTPIPPYPSSNKINYLQNSHFALIQKMTQEYKAQQQSKKLLRIDPYADCHNFIRYSPKPKLQNRQAESLLEDFPTQSQLYHSHCKET